MKNQSLSIAPTRRSTGPAYYELKTFSPNEWQMKTTVRGFDKRYSRPFPWGALLMLGIAVAGLVRLGVAIWG